MKKDTKVWYWERHLNCHGNPIKSPKKAYAYFVSQDGAYCLLKTEKNSHIIELYPNEFWVVK